MKTLHFNLLENKNYVSRPTCKLQECKEDLIKAFSKIFANVLKHSIIKMKRVERIK